MVGSSAQTDTSITTTTTAATTRAKKKKKKKKNPGALELNGKRGEAADHHTSAEIFHSIFEFVCCSRQNLLDSL